MSIERLDKFHTDSGTNINALYDDEVNELTLEFSALVGGKLLTLDGFELYRVRRILNAAINRFEVYQLSENDERNAKFE